MSWLNVYIRPAARNSLHFSIFFSQTWWQTPQQPTAGSAFFSFVRCSHWRRLSRNVWRLWCLSSYLRKENEEMKTTPGCGPYIHTFYFKQAWISPLGIKGKLSFNQTKQFFNKGLVKKKDEYPNLGLIMCQPNFHQTSIKRSPDLRKSRRLPFLP